MSDFFSYGIYFNDESKSKKAFERIRKRRAKVIAKQEGIPHHQALDKASLQAGFHNWKHFTEQIKKQVSQSTKRTSREIINVKESNLAEKVSPYRNLLVAATNELLENKLISLDVPNNLSSEDEDGYLFTMLFGFPSVVIWRDIGFDELQISVWWKYDHNKHPQVNLTDKFKESFKNSSPLAKRQHYRKFVGVVATAWLERKTGKYLQGKDNDKIFDRYTRKAEKAELEKLPVQKPNGFKIEGKFFF